MNDTSTETPEMLENVAAILEGQPAHTTEDEDEDDALPEGELNGSADDEDDDEEED
ncbi:MAG: hypothetical protein HKL92_02835 [Candidatus Eremiobacteraeota bacterium]|nr:hypothetical protein [Candidatus Eremiobacteraeota bacterium]NNM92252.1 hypothetical protein [Candidatus Eremiobacteraeota bacterium]